MTEFLEACNARLSDARFVYLCVFEIKNHLVLLRVRCRLLLMCSDSFWWISHRFFVLILYGSEGKGGSSEIKNIDEWAKLRSDDEVSLGETIIGKLWVKGFWWSYQPGLDFCLRTETRNRFIIIFFFDYCKAHINWWVWISDPMWILIL